jgi:hypothetical protein
MRTGLDGNPCAVAAATQNKDDTNNSANRSHIFIATLPVKNDQLIG